MREYNSFSKFFISTEKKQPQNKHIVEDFTELSFTDRLNYFISKLRTRNIKIKLTEFKKREISIEFYELTKEILSLAVRYDLNFEIDQKNKNILNIKQIN